MSKADFELLLNGLWDFTSNNDLGEWEERIVNFIPEVVLKESYEEQCYLSLEQFEDLKNTYALLPSDMLECIDAIIEVGRSNLYSGTVGYSESTLASTMLVVRYMLSNNFSLPPIEKFRRSLFSEEDMHGWGKRVDRGFFQ